VRSFFIDSLNRRGTENESLYLMTGDLGYNVVELFRDNFPNRFVNCGVAEQSMITMAAAIASEGNIVFAYSISNFATFRCLEQIRNDVAYHNRSVCIVAVGAGTSYGTLGYSHHGLQDIAVMRVIPGMRIFAPGTVQELEFALDAIIDHPGPSYLRLGPLVGGDNSAENVDSAYELRRGLDVSLLVSGTLVGTALAARDICAERGVSVQVLSVPQISPLNCQEILRLCDGNSLITLEEHSVVGGFGSALLESLSALKVLRRTLTLGYPNASTMAIGNHEFMMTNAGLDVKNVADVVIEFAQNSRSA